MIPGIVAAQRMVPASVAPAPEVIDFVASAERLVTTAVSSANLSTPASTDVGDIVIASVVFFGTLTPPAAFTQIGTDVVLTGSRKIALFFYNAVSAGAQPYTWQQSASTYLNIIYGVFRGAGALEIKDTNSTAGTGADSAPLGSVAPTVSGQKVFAAVGFNNAVGSFPATVSITNSFTLIGSGTDPSKTLRLGSAHKSIATESESNGVFSHDPPGTGVAWATISAVVGLV